MIERYPFHERICHWLTGFAYVLLPGDGAGVFTHLILFWLAIVLGGGPTSR